MTKFIVFEHNTETDEIIERETTAEEEANLIAQRKTFMDEQAAAQKIADQKAALLLRLGITDDEAKLLLS